MRLKVISCDVMFREICHLAAHSPNQVDVEFLPKGLHDLKSAEMRERLQQRVDEASASAYEAVAMAYALCGNGLAGLRARSAPLVVPRAHDCIALFLGSRHRYQQYFDTHGGVYFKTSGWIERGGSTKQLTGYGVDMAALVAKYGEENAQYLYEELNRYRKTYSRFTYIEMGIEPDGRFENQTRAEATERGWEFEKIGGDISLLRRLVDGDWSEADFLVVPPGQRIAATYDSRIIEARDT
jgi:hypothetical protein